MEELDELYEDEKILCAAVKYKDIIVCGYRHRDCYDILKHFGVTYEQSPELNAQGFLTSHNRFVDRTIAFAIAQSQSQILKNSPIKDAISAELTSEDLY